MSDDTRQVLRKVRLMRSEVLEALEAVRVAISDLRHWLERRDGVVERPMGDLEPEDTRRLVRP